MLKEGLVYTSKVIVTLDNCASAVGSGGLNVFATPSMVALMENAAMNVVATCLPDGQTTVGGHISVFHMAPTKMGESVRAEAELMVVEGRKLTFGVRAFQGEKLIGEGTHDRFVVDKERFMK